MAKNLDSLSGERHAILNRMTAAITEGNENEFNLAFNDLATDIQETLRGEYSAAIQSNDSAILAARGVRQLTSAEQKFYNNLIDAMKSDVPQQALTGVDTVLPQTVIDRIFEDIVGAHPLLGIINFQNVSAVTKILTSTTGGNATWGKITSKVESELSAEFAEIELGQAKLSAWIPVSRDYLALGPSWLDRYIRTILAEALAVALEKGIIAGTGKDEPVGMKMKLTGAVDSVHSEKETVPVTALDPATYGTLLETLTKTASGKRRSVSRVVLIVNPSDYFTKVFPATTVRATDGTYSTNVFPFPTTVIQSAAVDEGKAIIGLPEKYFMGIAGGVGNSGQIEYSDQYKFLEMERTYMIYFYGYGQALDENAFIYADISGLKPTNYKVEIVENP